MCFAAALFQDDEGKFCWEAPPLATTGRHLPGTSVFVSQHRRTTDVAQAGEEKSLLPCVNECSLLVQAWVHRGVWASKSACVPRWMPTRRLRLKLVVRRQPFPRVDACGWASLLAIRESGDDAQR